MDRFIVKVSSPTAKPSFYWGSLLHGMLIELLPDPYPELLHSNGVRPLSMYVRVVSDTEFEWNLLSVDDDLSDTIEKVLRPDMLLKCRNQGADWTIEEIKRVNVTVAGYMARIYLAQDACKGISIMLRTPATHKTNGRYAIFPTVDYIAMNLRKHLIQAFPELPFDDDSVMQDILNHSYISRYELRSSTYNLEGHYVPGYYGRFEIHFDGPDPLRKLCETLFSFVEWCGVGAKTALGMGGCEVQRISDRRTKE